MLQYNIVAVKLYRREGLLVMRIIEREGERALGKWLRSGQVKIREARRSHYVKTNVGVLS